MPLAKAVTTAQPVKRERLISLNIRRVARVVAHRKTCVPYFFSFISRTITFPPSLFVFHSLNGIWIIFRELILIEEPKKLVSIIKKTTPSSSQKPKKTKRVRISNDLPTMSKTRKRL